MVGKRIKRVCQYCGKEFYVYSCYTDHKNGHESKYCSLACVGKAHKTSVKQVCAVCGKEFNARLNRVKKGFDKYCSQECMGRASTTKIKKVCAYCGREFEVKPSLVERGYGKYCSSYCFSKAISGESGPNWHGGISFGKYCPKFNSSFKKRVRAFFGNKCALCGKSVEENDNEVMHVHHVDYEKGDCCNGNREPLFVPLCKHCHARTNYYREEWELFFRQYLAMGYNNKCFYTEQEYQNLLHGGD